MYLFLCIAIPICLGFIVMAVFEAECFEDWGAAIFGGAIASCIAALIIGGVLTAIFNKTGNSKWETTTENYDIKYELLALNDNIQISSSMKGAFFIGIGGVKGSSEAKMYYVFYTQKEDGEVVFNRVSPESVHLYEDSDKPYFIKKIEKTTEICREEWRGWLLNGTDEPNINVGVLRKELHVPKGTVLRNYTLNLE